MATYNSVTRSASNALAATTADTINFLSNYRYVVVSNVDTTNGLWARADGLPAAIAGDGSYYVGPGASITLTNEQARNEPALGIANRLTVSVYPNAGTPIYAVSGA